MSALPERPRLAGVALAAALCLGASAGRVEAPDRLDRFRQLAVTQLSLAQIIDTDGAAYRDVYALLDEEIVDNLASGGVFASLGFLQDRLDAFAEAWGAAVLHVRRVGPLFVGTFVLGDGGAGASSVRIYGRLRGEAALLATLDRGGRPQAFALSAGATAPAEFVVAWEGAPSGRGTRALRLDLVRQHGDGVRTVWSTADLFPQGLQARSWSVRGTEIRVRYELRYPGWVPGCEAQTEAEDVFRLSPETATFVRVARQQHNAWHRELRSAADGVFAALATGDRAALTGIVPDPSVREGLPAALRPEPACDAVEGREPDTASIAASASDGRPWTLTFHRAGSRWRLTAAAPVLQ